LNGDVGSAAMLLKMRTEDGSVYGFVQSGALRARKRLIQRSLNTGRTNEEPSVFRGFRKRRNARDFPKVMHIKPHLFARSRKHAQEAWYLAELQAHDTPCSSQETSALDVL
jgi:hypothetical protein